MNTGSHFYPRILAVDIGFGNTKAVWGQEGDRGWSETIFRSICPPAVTRQAIDGIAKSNRVLVEAHGNSYFVGPHADRVRGGIQSLNPDYINTPQYEALLCGAWHYMMRDVGCIVDSIDTLVLGLPVSDFNAKCEILREIGMRPRRIPLPEGMRTAEGNDWVEARAKRVKVVPQPLGMLVYAGDLPGFETTITDETRVLSIDPGHYTFDWLVSDGAVPRMDLSESFAGGVSQLLKCIARQITLDHGGASMDTRRIEEALVKGEIHLGHSIVPMEPYREVAENEAALVVDMFLQRFNPTEHGVTSILLSGGGAALYLKALQKRLPKYVINMLPEGAMSNARGYYLVGL